MAWASNRGQEYEYVELMEYDPYSDEGSSCKSFYSCMVCGSLVSNQDKHDAWHETVMRYRA